MSFSSLYGHLCPQCMHTQQHTHIHTIKRVKVSLIKKTCKALKDLAQQDCQWFYFNFVRQIPAFYPALLLLTTSSCHIVLCSALHTDAAWSVPLLCILNHLWGLLLLLLLPIEGEMGSRFTVTWCYWKVQGQFFFSCWNISKLMCDALLDITLNTVITSEGNKSLSQTVFISLCAVISWSTLPLWWNWQPEDIIIHKKVLHPQVLKS